MKTQSRNLITKNRLIVAVAIFLLLGMIGTMTLSRPPQSPVKTARVATTNGIYKATDLGDGWIRYENENGKSTFAISLPQTWQLTDSSQFYDSENLEKTAKALQESNPELSTAIGEGIGKAELDAETINAVTPSDFATMHVRIELLPTEFSLQKYVESQVAQGNQPLKSLFQYRTITSLNNSRFEALVAKATTKQKYFDIEISGSLTQGFLHSSNSVYVLTCATFSENEAKFAPVFEEIIRRFEPL